MVMSKDVPEAACSLALLNYGRPPSSASVGCVPMVAVSFEPHSFSHVHIWAFTRFSSTFVPSCIDAARTTNIILAKDPAIHRPEYRKAGGVKVRGASYGATAGTRGVPQCGRNRMRTVPLGPSVVPPMGPRSA
eukprot:1165549-Pyramimonas_sp.AAC.1